MMMMMMMMMMLKPWQYDACEARAWLALLVFTDSKIQRHVLAHSLELCRTAATGTRLFQPGQLLSNNCFFQLFERLQLVAPQQANQEAKRKKQRK